MSPRVALYIADPGLWERARRAADARGLSLSEAVAEALAQWLDTPDAPQPSQAERLRQLRAGVEQLIADAEEAGRAAGDTVRRARKALKRRKG